MLSHIEQATLATRIRVRPDFKDAFYKWQGELHEKIVTFKGFVSLEIISPSQANESAWVIIQCLCNDESLHVWRQSRIHEELFNQLQPFLSLGSKAFEEELHPNHPKKGVIEVFVTQVGIDQVAPYREWIAKIHEAETKFPGFERVYMLAPKNEGIGSWVTLLQFDTPENLDQWLISEERQKILAEAKLIIKSLESHRVTSSFSAWFENNPSLSAVPPLWKQTMLILLVLFPIVMLEFRFLNPHLEGFNISLKTFIGNAISVSLVSWPLMPLAIYFLKWWLNPAPIHRFSKEIKGLSVVILLYLLEIFGLWYLV